MNTPWDINGEDDLRRRVEKMLEQEYASCRKKFIGWAIEWVRATKGKRIKEHDLVDLYHDAINIMLRKITLGTLTELSVAPCTFLIAIGKFTIPAWLRRHGRIDYGYEPPTSPDGDGSPGPLDKILMAELWDEVESLDEPGRTILLLTFKNGLSSKEIAELMDYASEDVVRQLRYRAMKELRFRHFVNQMDEPCRTIILLAENHRLDDRQIAQKMGFANADEARQKRENCSAQLKNKLL
jgi:DNA-directed RNA polymerase specialized sigma24 family protein